MNTKLRQVQKKPIPNSLQGQYAGFISRFLAFLIDIIVVIVTLTIVGGVFVMLVNFFGLSQFLDNLRYSLSVSGTILRTVTALWSGTMIAFFYFVLSWTVTSGKSVGKALIGLRIVPMDGSRITFWRSVWRYITFWFSVLFLALGVLWILVSDKRQGWHDKAAGTCVIYDWPAREDVLTIENLQNRWTYFKESRFRIFKRKPRLTDQNPDHPES